MHPTFTECEARSVGRTAYSRLLVVAGRKEALSTPGGSVWTGGCQGAGFHAHVKALCLLYHDLFKQGLLFSKSILQLMTHRPALLTHEFCILRRLHAPETAARKGAFSRAVPAETVVIAINKRESPRPALIKIFIISALKNIIFFRHESPLP